MGGGALDWFLGWPFRVQGFRASGFSFGFWGFGGFSGLEVWGFRVYSASGSVSGTRRC